MNETEIRKKNKKICILGIVPENMCTEFDAKITIFRLFKVGGKFGSGEIGESVTIFGDFGQILKGLKKSSKLNFDMSFFATCSLYRDLLNGRKIG